MTTLKTPILFLFAVLAFTSCKKSSSTTVVTNYTEKLVGPRQWYGTDTGLTAGPASAYGYYKFSRVIDATYTIARINDTVFDLLNDAFQLDSVNENEHTWIFKGLLGNGASIDKVVYYYLGDSLRYEYYYSNSNPEWEQIVMHAH